MSIKFALGLDHLGNMNSSVTPWAKLIEKLPFTVLNAPGNVKRVVVSDGWLTSQITSATTWLAVVFDMAPHFTPETKISWFGFRWKVTSGGSITAANSLLWLSVGNYIAGNPIVNFLTWGDFVALYPDYNREFYFEAGIDWENNVLRRRVNGVELSSLSLSSLAVGVSNKTLRFNIAVSSHGMHSNSVRDFVLVNNDEVGVQGPIGPHKLVALEETPDPETEWTSSNGVLNAPVTTKVDGASNTDTPAWVSPNPKTPLKIGLQMPSGVLHRGITAVAPSVSAGLASGAVGDLKVNLTNDVDSSPVTTLPLTVGVAHHYRLPVFEKALDGSDWDASKIDATSMVIEAT